MIPETVLIIGGAGYIGTNLAEKLVRNGHRVAIFDNETYGPNPLRRLDLVLGGKPLSAALSTDVTKSDPKKPRDYEFIYGDTRDRQRVEDVIGSGFRYVFHFGELVGINACETDPDKTRTVNFEGTSNVVDGVLASSHQPRYIWNSSSSVYHISSDGTLFTEKSPLPDSESLDEYCRNKVSSEKYLLGRSGTSRDFEYVALRPATVGGLSPRTRIELMPNHIAYSFLTSGRFALANPGDCRALIDVEDLTDFYVSLIGAKNWHNGIFNLGGLNGSKQEFVSIICELVGLGHDTIVQVPKAGDLRNLTISSKLAHDTYGFTPRRGLADMVAPIITLVRENPNVFSLESRNPLLVDREFTNTPPEEFKNLLEIK